MNHSLLGECCCESCKRACLQISIALRKSLERADNAGSRSLVEKIGGRGSGAEPMELLQQPSDVVVDWKNCWQKKPECQGVRGCNCLQNALTVTLPFRERRTCSWFVNVGVCKIETSRRYEGRGKCLCGQCKSLREKRFGWVLSWRNYPPGRKWPLVPASAALGQDPIRLRGNQKTKGKCRYLSICHYRGTNSETSYICSFSDMGLSVRVLQKAEARKIQKLARLSRRGFWGCLERADIRCWPRHFNSC